MAELTPNGYTLKTQNEWFDEEKALYLQIDPNWNLDPSTPDGLKLAHDAEIFSALDETLQQAYNARDPNKARGLDLDVVCSLTGVRRQQGTSSTVTLTLGGVAGTLVRANSRVESTTTGSRWTIPQDVTLGVNGTATTQAICTTLGPVEADPGTLTRIVDVIGGWQSATNASPATPGTSREDDSDLRIRRATTVGRPGNNQIDAMYGELYATAGVRRVRVYENDTDSSTVDPVDNPHGLPKNSVAIVVDGGTDEDVARAIFVKKNPGPKLAQVGTPVAVTVTSEKYPSNSKLIRYSRPVYVDVVIVVTIKNDGTLPNNVADLIKEAVVEFGNGQLVEADCGFKQTGFDIGDDVPYFSVSVPVNKVIGSYGNSYITSLTLNGGTSDVVIAYNQLSRWTIANVTVTLV